MAAFTCSATVLIAQPGTAVANSTPVANSICGSFSSVSANLSDTTTRQHHVPRVRHALRSGSVRSKNTSNILLANVINCAIGVLFYYLFGFTIAVGSSSNGLIGTICIIHRAAGMKR